MSNRFDDIAKSLAQSVTRRAALRKFGLGLAGMALACFGLASKAGDAPHSGFCVAAANGFDNTKFSLSGYCQDATTCQQMASSQCKGNVKSKNVARNPCDSSGLTVIDTSKPCSF